MTNLTPSASFDSVQELETTTVALGGPGAPMNVQAQALLNRTQYLYVQLSNLASVASTGDYNSLINRPALGSAAYQPSSTFATAAQGAKADGAAQASSLSAVAFSGSYNDLLNRPSILPDAPGDGNIYGRRNGSWVVAVAGSPMTNPMIAAGDIIIGSDGGTPSRLGIGSSWEALIVTPSGTLEYANPNQSPLVGINDQTGTSYVLSLSDAGKDVRCTNASAITLTIPSNASMAFPIGTMIAFSQGGSGAVTATSDGTSVICAANGSSTTAQYDARVLEKTDTDIWRVW